MINAFESLCEILRSNPYLSSGVAIGGILEGLATLRSLSTDRKLHRISGTKFSPIATFCYVSLFAVSIASIFLVCCALTHPISETKSQSETLVQSETLKEGDEIVVVGAPNRLNMWENYYRNEEREGKKKDPKGSVKNGATGTIQAILPHNDYIMHDIIWCNGQAGWVSGKSLDGTEIYLKKR